MTDKTVIEGIILELDTALETLDSLSPGDVTSFVERVTATRDRLKNLLDMAPTD